MRSQSFVVVFLMILRLFRWYAQKHCPDDYIVCVRWSIRATGRASTNSNYLQAPKKSWESSSIQIKATWNWFLLCSMIRRDPEQLNLSLNFEYISLFLHQLFIDRFTINIHILRGSLIISHSQPFSSLRFSIDLWSFFSSFSASSSSPRSSLLASSVFFRCARLKVIHGERRDEKKQSYTLTRTHNGSQELLDGSMKRERITNKLFNFVLTWLEISCSFLSLLNSPFLHVSFDLVWRSRSHLFHFLL